jgi:8-amino-7-oxononanoate synthase
MSLHNRIASKLHLRKQEGTFRSLISDREGVDFWSNDYLGYARSPITVSSESGGSTGSRLISGNLPVTEQLEQKLADFFKGETALLFNSGYDANLGLLSSLPQKNDIVLYDEHIHASMRDGIRLSFAKSYGFQHNSLTDLEKKLQIEPGENGVKFVCIESLYSMGGDFSPLYKIIELCEKYDAYLILDEAHSGGLFGENGEGFSIALELQHRIFARVYTFGKAFGCHGAVVVGSDLLRQFLINYSRSLIYTTALPHTAIAHIHENVFRTDNDALRRQLFANITYFRKLCKEKKSVSMSEINSPIQMIRVGDIQKTLTISARLKENGFLVKAILSPTVKEGDESIRICLHAFNTREEIEKMTLLLF